MHAVIMTGGRGTRLQPYTDVLPKSLLPVGGQPILETIVRQLVDHGFTHLTLACGYLSKLIQTYFGDGHEFGAQIQYHTEVNPLGTVGAVACLKPMDEPFLVMNCDVLTTLNYAELFRFHRQRGGSLTIATHLQPVPFSLGVIEANGEYVTDFREKPEQVVRVSMGIYVMDPTVRQYIPRRQRFDVPDLIQALLLHREPVLQFETPARWLDIGQQADYEQANQLFAQHADEFIAGGHS